MALILAHIEHKIYTIRGVQVMLDSDLADLYHTETKFINRAVKRNSNRFPSDFAFHLTHEEWDSLRCQFGTLKKVGRGQHRKFIPIVFTEQGVAMLSAVLSSDIAIEVSVHIMQAFVAMRKTLGSLQGLIQRLETVELKQLNTDVALEKVFKALETDYTPQQGIFFEGQLFDAYVFVSQLIKQAKKRIILVDNYIDENTLMLLSKRRKNVQCVIYAKPNPHLKKDLEKHNRQYAPIQWIENKGSHDRFLILDDKQLYHIGASLKDLGKSCFAFSRMDDLLIAIKHSLLNDSKG
jgi:hypothetical protein